MDEALLASTCSHEDEEVALNHELVDWPAQQAEGCASLRNENPMLADGSGVACLGASSDPTAP